MNRALALAGPGVPDTEALRHNALVASWQRDRRVASRRVRQRWMIWGLLRIGLPLLLAGSLAIGLELSRPGFWQVLLLRGEWPDLAPATSKATAATAATAAALLAPAAPTVVQAEVTAALPAVAATPPALTSAPMPEPTSEPTSGQTSASAPLSGAPAAFDAMTVSPSLAGATSSPPPQSAGDAPPKVLEPIAPVPATRPALRFDLLATPPSPSPMPTNPHPGVTRP